MAQRGGCPAWIGFDAIDSALGVAGLERDGTIVYANERLGAICSGVPLVGATFDSLAAPECADILCGRLQKRGGSAELSLAAPVSGPPRWARFTIVPAKRGRLIALVEELDGERAGHPAEVESLRLQKITAHLSGFLYEIRGTQDGAMSVEFASDKVETFTGLSPAEVVQQAIDPRDLVHPDDRHALDVALRQAAAQVGPVTVGFRLVRGRQSHEMLTTATITHLSNGEMLASGVALDVGESRRQEARLRASKAQLNAIFDNFPFEVWAFDECAVFQLQNPLSVERWGYRVGLSLSEAGLPEEVAREWERETASALAGEVVRRDGACRAESRVRFYTRLSAPILDGARVLGVVGVSIDTTDQRRLEEQLRQTQKLDAIGRLAGGIAHDFNNVLTAIMSCVHLLERRLDGPPRKELQIIRDGAQRASGLTKQLLTFARQGEVEVRHTAMSEIVLRADRLMRRLIGADIELVTLASEGNLTAMVDPVRIEQALINLVVNARDAMPSGGKLTLRAEHRILEAPERGVGGEIPAGSYVLISVEDTGSGMAPETVKRAFEPFFTTRLGTGGTGLGLSSVYGSVRQAQGHVQLESELGRGTCVRLFLPQVSAAAAPLEGERSEACESLSGHETILLVEDEPLVRSVTEQTLGDAGYRVLTARNHQEALRVARDYTGTIHLLLTDIVLPLGSGLDLAATLCKEREGLALLFISGYTADRASLDERERRFLPKPFTPGELARAVRGALSDG